MEQDSFKFNKDETHKDCSIQTEEVLFHMCEMCDSKFLSDDRLRAHRHEEHRDEDQFHCRSCTKHYSRLNHLQRHIAYSHPELSNIRFLKDNLCNICNKTFTRSDHLRRHIENVHRELVHFINLDQIGEEQPITDNDIEMKATDDDNTEQIVGDKSESENEKVEPKIEQLRIKTEKPQLNALCTTEEEEETEISSDNIPCKLELKEEILNKQEIDEHEDYNNQDHFDDEDEEDDEEEQMSTKKQNIKTEIDSVPINSTKKKVKKLRNRVKQDYSCDECNLQFNVWLKYAKHMEGVHQISKLFKCKTCEKTFGRATHLRRHEMTHLDVKPYACDQCEKRFSRMDHLNLHKTHHSEVKPYNCNKNT